ncbi:MAG: short-chain dehydrogenase/reductase [Planctomycetota bacterium]|nr:MAG: short-chain dehydrogenase/reductase [Planctomycetota bacterium]
MSAQPCRTLLTGASSGIGRGLALALARRGDRLALLARRAEALREVAAQARAQHPQGEEPLVLPADVCDRAAVRAAVAQALERLGGLELVILNAGVGDPLRVERFDDERAARVIEINLIGNLYVLGAALPPMLERRTGHLVGISSLAGWRGLPGSGSYSASKAGFSVLLESLRVDLRRYGIAVTTVEPGFVRTPLTERNRHPMPFLMELEPAVARIVRGIERRRRYVRFPWPLVLATHLVRALPGWLYDALAARLPRSAKAER